MTERVQETPQDAPQVEPSRRKFAAECAERCRAFTDQLITDIPELRGLIVGFIWDLDVPAAGNPFGCIQGRDIKNAVVQLRTLEQLTKLLHTVTDNVATVVGSANEVFIDLSKKLDDKKAELSRLEEAAAAAKPIASGGTDVTGGSAGLPKDH